ncbi:MAG TPA: hypothetical protein DC048_08350 [Planctomycetaceae bacterium]|nr:hypothetical protein [Planctomycetaceae bacterium]
MNESTPASAGGSGVPDPAVHDMIASHLDGALDAAGQRRLAAELARSPEARRTLVTFLRVEAAIMRLALAGQFDASSGTTHLGAGARPAGPVRTGHADLRSPPASVLVPAAGEASSSRQGGHAARLRSAALALAGCLLMILAASPFLVSRRDVIHPARDDMDRLADEWLRVARHDDVAEEPEAIGAAGAGEASLDDEADPGPPAWLVAAMGDEDMPSLSPDAG